jgi:predicted MPP superfamily phosphohydrolase
MGFLFVFFVIVLLLDVYIFQSVKTVVGQSGFHWAYFIYWAFCSLTYLAFLLFALLGKDGFHGYPRVILMGISMSFLVLKLVTLPFLFISDIIRGLEWLNTLMNAKKTTAAVAGGITRSAFLNKMGLMAGGLFFGAFIYGFIRGAYQIQVKRLKIMIPGLPETLKGLKIVQISDLHLGSFAGTSHVERAVEMINSEQPDLFFFTGDLVNDKAREVLPFRNILSKIKARYGKFSILGNHDYGDYVQWTSMKAKEENLQNLIAFQQALGWDMLLDENKMLDINGSRVAVLGVQYWGRSMGWGQRGKIEEAVKGIEGADLRLLLSHDPSHWDFVISKEEKYKDIHITFSGHTHGFQFGIEIPGFKFSPSQWVYPHWAGLYTSDNGNYLYVNRGLGFLGYPGRVGIPPEITVIELG